jgi:hypothetical protein
MNFCLSVFFLLFVLCKYEKHHSINQARIIDVVVVAAVINTILMLEKENHHSYVRRYSTDIYRQNMHMDEDLRRNKKNERKRNR